MRLLLRSAEVIFGLLLPSISTSTVAAAKPPSDPTYSAPSTCPSTTINYITATLAQQCLHTSWNGGRAPGRESPVQQASGNAVVSKGIQAPTATTNILSNNYSSTIYVEPSSQVAPANGSHTTTSEGSPVTSQPSQNDTSAEPSVTSDGDNDPLSDNASFLSFEDWKAQMLQKAGQSPEHISGEGVETKKSEKRRQADTINNALDSLGEEGEFEIEFGGFVTPDATPAASSLAIDDHAKGKKVDVESQEDKPQKQSKDAGTTSKERFNFASFDCAATVLKTNKGCKGATSILLENKDSYMLNACSTNNKHLVVELCNDILIDTIVLGNFEFFSSTFKEFRVSVSDRYPVKSDKWKEIGTFEARNTRGVQAFLVENGVIWARYLRIEFISHYGKEYYCPVSLLRVHGKTMMDDYRAEFKAAKGEDNDEEDVEDEPTEKVVAEPLKGKTSSEAKLAVATEAAHKNGSQASLNDWQDTSLVDKCPRKSLSSPLVQQVELFTSSCDTLARFCNMDAVKVIDWQSSSLAKSETYPSNVAAPKASETRKDTTRRKPSPIEKASETIGAKEASIKPIVGPLESAATPTSMAKSKSGMSPTASNEHLSSSKSDAKKLETTASSKSHSDQTATSTHKAPSQGTTNLPATQESFFKSVHKRLQQLEANSTLSLQYIEEQSRILREAFTKVEKRQLSKTSSFLESLNTTVLSELREFRLQYDQIWQSTVLELSSQREQSQKEVTALSQRLTLLADEILWQRRIAYLQFALILLCLGLVVFPRNQTGQPSFDLQSMVARPTTSFSRYFNFESPPGTPSRPGSRYGLFRRSVTHLRGTSQDTLSDEDLTKAPNIEYQLPTPEGSDDNDDGGSRRNSLHSSPEPDPLIRRAQSTPNLGKGSDDLLDSLGEDEQPAHSEAQHR